jgi:N-acetylmuramoyl-L-alanine amidase
MLNKKAGALVLAISLLAVSGTSAAAVDPAPQTDIVVDIGHGGVDGGTSYGTVLEKDINLSIGLKLYPNLRKQGLSVGMTRMKDYALSDDNPSRGSRHKRDLAQRVEVANRLRPVFLISLHVNWSENRTKTGPLVIYRKNHEPSKRLALRLQKELNALYGTSTQPEPSKKYFLLRYAKAPSVIIEMGYLSNSRDRTLLQSADFQKKIAEAIGKASGLAIRDDFKSRPAAKKKK